jgi:CAI-1 autoinducer synthase
MRNETGKLQHNQIYRNPVEPYFLEQRINNHYRSRVEELWGGRNLLHGKRPGPQAIHLMSNDYLSLSSHPDILQCQSRALLEEGNGMLMSAVFLHENSPQQQFERRLAHFIGAERGILCQSGWCANTGLIQSIADEQTPVYIDMLAHMSLWEGAHSAGATAIMFHHNDPDHLERQILKHGPGVIIVDSVYSTNGSVCPLQDIVVVGTLHKCALVVDESHSLGTHGKHGEGIVAAMGLTDKVHFRTASLAKAFAGRAGFIACSERFAEYFAFESNPAIFSSALLPHEVAGLNATLTIIQEGDDRRKKLHENADYLRQNLEQLGYNLNDSSSQILSLEPGTEPQALLLKDALESRGVFGSAFFAPATPKNRAIIRFSVNCSLAEEQLAHTVRVCAEIRDEVGMANWASTRRKRNSGTMPATLHNEKSEMELA